MGRRLLHKNGNETLRQYASGRYGLTIDGLRVVFSDVDIPSTSRMWVFLDSSGEQVGSIHRKDVSHELLLELDDIAGQPSEPK